MKILVATDVWFPDYIGGSARVARSSAIALAAEGHEVIVVAPTAHGEPTTAMIEGVRVERIVARRSKLPRTATFVPDYAKAIATVLSQHPCDVILSHHLPGTAGAIRVAGRPPVSYVFHASPRLEWGFRRAAGVSLRQVPRNIALEVAFGALERHVTTKVDQILVLSEFSRRILEQVSPRARDRVRLVSGGVDTAQFSPADNRVEARRALGVQPEHTLLLTVRRLVNRMGVDTLLHAFSAVLRDRDDLRLVIVGDGEESERLTNLALELGLASTVQFAGRLTDEDVVAWYRAADAFVLPTVAYEGFGMVSAEALACGTPVIASPAGANREVVGAFDSAFVSRSESPADLAETIASTLRRLTPELRKRCRRYAVAHLEWSVVVRGWENELTSVSSQPKP